MKTQSKRMSNLASNSNETGIAKFDQLPVLFKDYIKSDDFEKMSVEKKKEMVELFERLCENIQKINESINEQIQQSEQIEISNESIMNKKLSWYFDLN